MKHIQFDKFTRLYFVKTALTPQLKRRIRRWCREISSPGEVSALCLSSTAVQRVLPIEYEVLPDQFIDECGEACEYFMWFNSRQPSIIVLHATGDRIALLSEARDYVIKLAIKRERRRELLAHLRPPLKKIELASGT